MPFDGRDNAPALNRARLVEALRQPLPEWDFRRFDRCACHVAKLIGLITDHLDVAALARVIGISQRAAENIFVGGVFTEKPDFYGVHRSEVTPQMVADALERDPLPAEMER